MLVIVVTEAVLNKETDLKDEQPANIAFVLVSTGVLNKGTDFKLLQKSNMLTIVVT